MIAPHYEDECDWLRRLRRFYVRDSITWERFGDCALCKLGDRPTASLGTGYDDVQVQACPECWARRMAFRDGVHIKPTYPKRQGDWRPRHIAI